MYQKKGLNYSCVRDDACASNVCVELGKRVGDKHNTVFNGYCYECETEKECDAKSSTKGKACYNWKCVDKKKYNESCDRSGECEGDYECRGGVCRRPYASVGSDEICGHNSECKHTGTACNVKDGKNWRCSCQQDHECPGSKVCYGYKCVAKKKYNESCDRNSQCEEIWNVEDTYVENLILLLVQMKYVVIFRVQTYRYSM